MQFLPAPVAIDEDAALLKHTIQEKRGVCLNPREMRDVDLASDDVFQMGGEPVVRHRVIVGTADKQVQV